MTLDNRGTKLPGETEKRAQSIYITSIVIIDNVFHRVCSVTSKYIKGDGLPYTRMHASRMHRAARSCNREGRDRPLAESCLNLLDFFLLISARCLPGCDEQHGHCSRPNECM
jgi:hypothetical protein